MYIIVKEYSGFNRAMGKYITSKKHYQEEMRKGNYMEEDKAFALADKINEERDNPKFKLTKKAEDIIKYAGSIKDKKGNVKLGGRAIKAMKEVGVRFELPDWLPKHYKENKGGFDASQKR